MGDAKGRAGGLRAVPDPVKSAAPKPTPKRRRKPREPLSDGQRAQLERDMARGEAIVDALDLVAAAFGTAGARLAIERAQRAAQQLGDDVEHLHQVIAVLAVEMVWVTPPTVEPPRTAEQIVRRQVQLRIWAEERRRGTVSALRTGRRLLRSKP